MYYRTSDDDFGLDRTPLKEVLGGQYAYREREGNCCGRAPKAEG